MSQNPSQDDSLEPDFSIECPAGTINAWTMLLLAGAEVRLRTGLTTRATLVEELGMDPEYVQDVVKAIFMDGSPVDDIDTALVQPGCTIGLSTALPGVAGITMQRQSLISVFREGITHCEDGSEKTGCIGVITLKMFNFVAKHAGPAVLAKGVGLTGARWVEFLAGLEPGGGTMELTARQKGRIIPLAKLADTIRNAPDEVIHIAIVESADSP